MSRPHDAPQELVRLFQLEYGDRTEVTFRILGIIFGGWIIYSYTGWSSSWIWVTSFVAAHLSYYLFLKLRMHRATRQDETIAAVLFLIALASFFWMPALMICEDDRALSISGAALIGTALVFMVRRSDILPIMVFGEGILVATVILTVFARLIPQFTDPFAKAGTILSGTSLLFYFIEAARVSRRLRIEETKARESLWRAAHVDELSGIANRSWFNENLANYLVQATSEQISFHLILLDLDRFKEVNDVYGHPTGDLVLQVTAERLSVFFEQDAIIGRFGGDEFAVIKRATDTPLEMQTIVQRLVADLGATIKLTDVELQVGVSIGIARFPQDESTQEGLVRCADMALLHSKETQKGGASFFDAHIRSKAERRRAAIERVRSAGATGRITAHYQPRIHLATGKILGYEALARILEPSGEVSGPSLWGEALKDPECARLVDHQVLLAVAKDWPKLIDSLQGANLQPMGRVGLNISEFSLKRSEFVTELLDQLNRSNIARSAIEIEVLETVLIDETNPLLEKKLEELRQVGISIALDDFGTGFASLLHLRDLPVDRIKLDQSFVRDLDGDMHNRPIIRATVELAHALGIQIVAEGIETINARDFLRSVGCDEGQGFLFGTPTTIDAILGLKSKEPNFPKLIQ